MALALTLTQPQPWQNTALKDLNHQHGERVHDASLPERGVNNDDAQQTRGLTKNGLAKRGRGNGNSDANREQDEDENTMSMQEPKKSI